jgi:hypothetical protein
VHFHCGVSVYRGGESERNGLVVDNVLSLETISVDGDDFSA